MASGQDIAVATQIMQDHVLRPYENEFHPEAWRDLPEIPDKLEIMPQEDVCDNNDFFFEEEKWNAYQTELEHSANLPHNIIKGPWPSKEEYIAAHYQILREDAIASLRSSVKYFKRIPDMFDDRFIHIYTDVHFKGLLLGQSGPAFRIEFSHERAGKQIRWEQSSRLQQGTMVVLSPMNDMFRTTCRVAIVAARPIDGGLDQNPPQIDIFWGDHNEAVFDPVEPYVMLESRQGYFESSRHMLVALQKLRTESFQLSKHLVELDNDIGAPDWLEEQRLLDLTSLIHPESDIDPVTLRPKPIPTEEEAVLYNADVLQGFPSIPSSGMDESQMSACERMVTKKVSIVQGPPGTGKTFTSVSTLRVMVRNMSADSPPIIIAAQTNHALDQLMNHVLAFEPNVLRLGGGSDKENMEIQKRTLYMLRMAAKDVPNGSRGMKTAFVALENRINEIEMSMAPLVSEGILSVETLLREGIISASQKDSLYEEGWANGDQSGDKEASVPPLIAWLGPDQLVPIPRAPMINFGLPVEESDLEFEQLQQLELDDEESPIGKETDVLRGKWIPFRRQWTGRCPAGVEYRKVKKLLSSNKNLYDIPMGMRGPVYRFWEKKLNKHMLEKLRGHLKEYKSTVNSIRVTKWVNNYKLIRHLGIKVIACTTTGLSKYRGLLASLQPRTLLIEEAAETLEGTIIAGMFESLEQLILVGDHQQLQAHATIRRLEQEPYNLSISMFERLVNNSIGYTMLNKQRRMIPDVRKLLCIEPKPFYSNLQDHPSVLDRKANRKPVPGMGGKDTYFFHHTWPEGKNADQSRYNTDEAEMIAGFYNHLVMNGTEFSKITVLTFYNGQRKAILKELKRHPSLGGNSYFNVFTVDSYQGEENDVIILSLVRSNEYMAIGFLENKNRLVVALSRARRGLYIFGNAVTLTNSEAQEEGEALVREPLWEPVIRYMRNHGQFDLEGGLPITCTRHCKTIHIDEAAQWVGLAGGCNQKCPGKLRCGHPCPHPCHPFDHSRVICAEPCNKTQKCGHGCSNNCGEECYCAEPPCMALAEMTLGNELSQYDMPVAGDAVLGRATKNSHPRDPKFDRGGSNCSVSPKKDKYTSQDIRKDIRRDISGPTPKRIAPIENCGPKYGLLGGRRSTSSPVATTPSNRAALKLWNEWDAKKADREASEENQRLRAASRQVDQSTLVCKETYRAVNIEDGVRVKDPSSSTQRLVPRADVSPLAPVAPQPARSAHVPFKSIRAASQLLQAVLSENDPFTLPTDPPRAAALHKVAVSSNTFAPFTTRSVPKDRAPSKTVSLKNATATKISGPPKSIALAKSATHISVARSKSLPTSKCLAHSAHPRSKAALSYPQVLQQKKSEIEALMKKRIAEAEAAKAATRKAQQTPSGAIRKTAASPKVVAPRNSDSSGLSKLGITDQPELPNFEDSIMITQDRPSSSLTDLLGLEVGTPASDPFGNADDFDQFEKLFM